MTTQTEALKLALEALEECRRDPRLKYEHLTYDKAITAIKEALAQPEHDPYDEVFIAYGLPKPKQEPVAWGIIASNTGRICQVELDADEVEGHNPKHIVPLYTTPPQRTWVGLTNREFVEACQMAERGNYLVAFKRIQECLKEKNI